MSTRAKSTSGPGGQKPPAYVTLTQQLKPEYWPGWDVALILSGDVVEIGNELLRRYKAAGGDPQGLWIIKHDKDVLPDGSPKADHVHVVLQQSAQRTAAGRLQCAAMDKVFGWPQSIVRRPDRGGRIENAWAYLIHAKDPTKYQYPVPEVATICGRDYADIEREYRDRWARRAVVGREEQTSAKEWAELGDALVQKALDGEVTEMDILRSKVMMDIYTRNEAKVKLAFNVRAKRDMMLEVEKLRAGLFRKTVIWAMGASDQGKSYLVESAAARLAAETGWSIYRAAAKNGLDSYNGEQILILNEPSKNAIEWADLLQLFDERQAGPVSARYYNKPDAAPRAILVAVTTRPAEFFYFVPGKRSTSDSLDQGLRRIALQVTAHKDNGVPTYKMTNVEQTTPFWESIEVPSREGKGTVIERVAIGYGEGHAIEGLGIEEAVDVIVGEVAQRSPDVEMSIAPGRTFAALTATAKA